MNQQQVLEVLTELAVEVLMVDPSTITLETDLKDDLGADSLDLVELVMALEERLDVVVEETELEGVTTVKAAVDIFVAKVAADA